MSEFMSQGAAEAELQGDDEEKQEVESPRPQLREVKSDEKAPELAGIQETVENAGGAMDQVKNALIDWSNASDPTVKGEKWSAYLEAKSQLDKLTAELNEKNAALYKKSQEPKLGGVYRG